MAEQNQTSDAALSPIGSNDHFIRAAGTGDLRQQPIEAQVTISAASKRIMRRATLLVTEARRAFEWFSSKRSGVASTIDHRRLPDGLHVTV